MVDVSCGQRHTLGLSADGRVFSWGNGEFGRLGTGKSEHPNPEPVEVEDLDNPDTSNKRFHSFKAVCAGQIFSTAITTGGKLFVWGKNDQAQLGLGPNMAMDINTMEEYPLEVKVTDGASHLISPSGKQSCCPLA